MSIIMKKLQIKTILEAFEFNSQTCKDIHPEVDKDIHPEVFLPLQHLCFHFL